MILNQKKITDANGGIALVSEKGELAALWHYEKVFNHWKRKHANTVYVPSMRMGDKGNYHYRYSNNVQLFSGTNVNNLLNGVLKGSVYLDPGVKAENVSSKNPTIKRRNQFRVRSKNIADLYNTNEEIDLLKYRSS